jgi:putative Mg2+ transporter-C (MgtC) family protein
VTGIGFLGAGAILREGLSVRGLTTAGSLWVVAAIGMGAGAGFYWAAVAGTVLTIVALWPLGLLATETEGLLRPGARRCEVELRPGRGAGEVLDVLGDRVRHLEVRDDGNRRTVLARLERADDELLRNLSDLDSVESIRWKK